MKPYRTLTLTTPFTSGPDVAAMQRRLHGVNADGVFGPQTAEAIKSWRYRVGIKVWNTPTMPVRAQLVLLGVEKRTAAEIARAKVRAKAPARPVIGSTGSTIGERAVAHMERWADAGYREIGTSNVVPPLQEIARTHNVSAGLVRMGWPWCAFATSLSNLIVGGEHGTVGLVKWGTNPLYCPTILADADAGRYGLRVVPKNEARRGDLLLFSWNGNRYPGHIGRARGPFRDGIIETVEANTSRTNAGSQSNGGYVAKRTRNASQICAVVRESK